MVMMITAEDESKRIVTTVPVTIALNVFEVNLRIQFLEFSPIAF